MANDRDQSESKLPITGNEPRQSSDLLPRFYRTKSNKKFIQATLDQLVQPGTVKKINGYIGNKTAKSVTKKDIFLEAANKERQDYQLEPAAVIKDFLGNTTFFKDYIDHINHIDVFGGITNNHGRLNKEEFYSWNPHVCWDKFVNYQQYYWLPFGPESISIPGQQLAVQSTYTVKAVDEEDNVAYLFTPNGLTRNPVLRLFRGQTYKFDVSAKGHPFSIKTSRTAGTLNRYNKGVSMQSVEKGILEFTVPEDAPDVLFYVSDSAVDTGGVFKILDIEENTFLDVENDILGKKTYSAKSGKVEGLSLSNGMKVKFTGNVEPEKYGVGFWYVEGVGESITLISERELEVRSTYSQQQSLLFDDLPFDQLPFSESSSFAATKDYIVINRASPDNNPWSRYNKWFHQDVIIKSAEVNGRNPDLDQSRRAVRPIIEFNSGIKLFNHGLRSKNSIDVIDNFTKDAFSTVEGTLGYNVDGIDLADGMRIIFNADTDILVKNKIYKVNFIEVIPPGREIYFSSENDINIETDVITFSAEHGLTSRNQITYIADQDGAIPGLINRQTYFVKVINPFSIELHTSIALDKKVDIFQTVPGEHRIEIYLGKRRQIYLSEEPDAVPNEFDTVSVRFGTNEQINLDIKGNQSQTYWFDGSTWKLAQYKSRVNQPPLFDVFDKNGNSLSEESIYNGSTFKGTKIFSYKEGRGAIDTELKFPLSYQNINNIGDIVFEFNLLKDQFSYKENLEIKNLKIDTGFLKIVNEYSERFENAWTISNSNNYQPVVRVFKDEEITNNFPIDVFDDKDRLQDIEIRVYVNGIRLDKSKFRIEESSIRKIVVLDSPVNETDVVTLKCFCSQNKNNKGYYEIPVNLQNNPLNENIEQFTLGQVVDHVDSIVDSLSTFQGIFPGNGNLRDLGFIAPYGTRFVQHSGPLNLALYHFGSKNANIIKALDKARNDYGKFKRSFVIAATESGIDTDPKRHVDFILQSMFKDSPKTSPYYLSDMFGYSASTRLEYTVLDNRIKLYPLTSIFNLKSLSNKSVNLYLNGLQLIEGKDYVFGDDVFFEILRDIEEGDLIEAYEYETTDGCFCPPTPTKLGLYPKFEPKKFIDDTYLEPTEVIQGHDGSIIIAYGDYRDDLILELETRIYNNIKVQYDRDIFNVHRFIPGHNRNNSYTKEEFDRALSKFFFQWTTNVPQDYTKHGVYDRLNSFTFNYKGNSTPDQKPLPASWRGIYLWLFDTMTPHLTPWECLGFTVEPKWWKNIYGVAPYTSDNFNMWDDIQIGLIREPGRPPFIEEQFARPILQYGKPVDQQGRLISPLDAEFSRGFIRAGDDGFFVFGDGHTVESVWRKSSFYPFAVIETALLLEPNYVLGRGFDRSRIVRNLNNQLVYSETNLRIKLRDIVLPSTYINGGNNRNYTAGLVNYIIEYLTSSSSVQINAYSKELKELTNNLTTRIGSFTSKPKYKILLDSRTPSSSGGVFIPEENYGVNLNISSAVKKVNYSGLIITKFADGFEIKGYNFGDPYFTYYPGILPDRIQKVGGISESFLNWETGKLYVAGKIIRYNNQFFRVKTTHSSGEVFDDQYYSRLPELPVVGGREAMFSKRWDNTNPKILAYGTKLESIQEVVDFIQGYGAYLEDQGFVFDDFNINTSAVSNWETSAKEFMFWTTQNWSVGSVIALSPAASRLIFNSNLTVVDDITDPFNGYSVFKVDGEKLDPAFISVYRSGNEFVLEPENTNFGIYSATLFLLQKEHVIVLDDTTLFNDIIYDKPAGYRQQRIKVLGYITSNWNGGFEIPGFIYDQTFVREWEPWTDYSIGDIVKHKEFYYSAKKVLTGSEKFSNDDWLSLNEKPTNNLIPNLDYKAEQFTDFYDLDTDNFDIEQQKIAQHLIGYQTRQYLENIIKNDVSQYKFYQGMIQEKGTQNVLNKLFDVLSADDQESLTFDEEWAFRIGEFGALDTFKEYEFKLNDAEFRINPQPIELVDEIDINKIDFVYRQRPTDVYIKPEEFNKNFLPITDKRNYLRTPGFVRKEDIDLNIDSLDDLLTSEIELTNGSYIWTAFEGTGWNVYRQTLTNIEIISAAYADSKITVVCSDISKLSVGMYVYISGTEKLNGYCKIDRLNSNSFEATKTITGFTPFTDQETATISILISQRLSSIDDINQSLTFPILENELFWVDDNGKNLKAVYKNNKVYSGLEIRNPDQSTNLQFGEKLVVSNNGIFSSISDSKGVTIYSKGSSDNNWVAINRFNKNISEPTDNFGEAMAFSPDSKLLAIASPALKIVKFYKLNVQNRYILNAELSLSSTTSINKIVIGNDGTNYVIAIADKTADQVLIVKELSENSFIVTNTLTGSSLGERFGSDISMSSDVSVIAVSAENYLTSTTYGKIYLFDQSFTQTTSKILSLDNNDLIKVPVAVSSNGLFVSFRNHDDNNPFGKVTIFKKENGSFNLDDPYQTLTSFDNFVKTDGFTTIDVDIDGGNSSTESLEVITGGNASNNGFGIDIKFTNSDKTIILLSKIEEDFISVYDHYNLRYMFGETIVNIGAVNSISCGNNVILSSNQNSITSYVKPANVYSWKELRTQSRKIDVSKIKKSFLYNTKTNLLVEYLDVVDPDQGKIPGIADQEIKYKTYFDPAIYSVGNNLVNIDDGLNWSSNQVGMLWWDLTRAKFLDTESGDVVYKSSAWNRLYDTASIDIYEWVESTLTPSAWDKIADTDAGLVKGISGLSKYGDQVYSIKRRYDTISQSFKVTYYFWVKNKKTIPDVEGRSLSSVNVSRLIEDPTSYGYTCLAMLDTNSFSLVNGKKYLVNDTVALNLQLWTSDKTETNYHTEWKLLSTNRNTIIPKMLEEKWFHSLVGKDERNRPVPDLDLPLKQRYGIEFRPRQSMFVNRIEALKIIVDNVNSVLINELITDNYDLTFLTASEEEPSEVSGLWDVMIDTDLELRFINTSLVRQASIKSSFIDGKLTDIEILDPGLGYGRFRPYQVDQDNNPLSWYGPNVNFSGTGINAEVKSIINSIGSIIGFEIINSGEGYAEGTKSSIRPFAVLVKNDTSSLSKWSIFNWDLINKEWVRTQTQKYNVRNYWEYRDWYAEGFNQFVKIDYLFENTYELVTTDIPLGSIVKIKNIGAGGWVLLEKVDDVSTIDYTINYNTIGRQQGTIQFLPSLYDFNKGYDNSLLDTFLYDNYPVEEIRLILKALRDKILVDNLRVEYLKLFFATVRYVMQEQTLVDWAFKTSFVKSQHNVGLLKQKVNYNNDNLEYFENYIKEVKPYRTKVREYVSNYSSVDNSQTTVTDFDLLPVIDDEFKVSPLNVYIDEDNQIQANFQEIQEYPWKHWKDNLGFTIKEIKIVDQGNGYVTRPIVNITGKQLPGGTPAVAKAYIALGKINRIELVDPGSKWVSAPTIEIKGGLSEQGSTAKATAIIGDSVVRSSHVKIKFDRISKVFEILDLSETEMFTGSGSRNQFKLKWSPDISIGNSRILVDGVEMLVDDYQLSTSIDTSKGYTRHSGTITFVSPPAKDSEIIVNYFKNFEHLSATDRISFYYNPSSGQTGKDLAQLMQGIDYGGVSITGISFGNTLGWNADPWFTQGWDELDTSFADFGASYQGDNSFRLPYIPEEGEEINIYIAKLIAGEQFIKPLRIDDPNYLTINQTNQNALMKTFVGDGETDVIFIPDSIGLEIGDRVLFRRKNSDGSRRTDVDSYDTLLSGGDISYQTATGVSPDDILLDGDDFVTPMTSHAPEEIVPGHVSDALSIKVYHRPSGGCPKILFNTHVADGDKTDFAIGQYFPNNNSVIVKVDQEIKQVGIDFEIDYQNNVVRFNVAPAKNLIVSVLSISFNSANLLDLNYFVSDGETIEYITAAPWMPNINSTVLVNGENLPYEIFSTDERYTDVEGQTWRSRVGIRFSIAPTQGSIINYIIDTVDVETTASVIRSENVTYQTGVDTYNLFNPIGKSKPFESNVLVKNNQKILVPAGVEYFDLDTSQIEYPLRDYKYEPGTVNATDLVVYKNEVPLQLGRDYNINFNYQGISYTIVKESAEVTSDVGYQNGDVLELVGGDIGLFGSSARLEVTRVNPLGKIILVEVVEPGSYLDPLPNPIQLSGGSGLGATLNCDFVLQNDRPRMSIVPTPGTYNSGDKLTVVINVQADYFINDNNQITFTDTYANGTNFEIISFYNHNVLGIERTVDSFTPNVVLSEGVREFFELTGKLGGIYRLRSPALSGDYVWVIKNGDLLMNNVDYYLEDDYRTIKLRDYLTTSDTLQLIVFTNTVVTDNFGFMQFKDMLNRVHYKRLNLAKTTQLSRGLSQYDKEIEVVDASVLDKPNPALNLPGIIEINGERIEYFTRVGNILGQLRRATLGTGAPVTHASGTLVQNIGFSETIPYKDTTIVNTIISDGETSEIELELPFVPTADDVEVFVGGFRLKKADYVLYSNIDYPYSPEGNLTLPAEFQAVGSFIRLTTVPPQGIKIIIVRKQGKIWSDPGKRLANSNNPIASFVKAARTPFPTANLRE